MTHESEGRGLGLDGCVRITLAAVLGVISLAMGWGMGAEIRIGVGIGGILAWVCRRCSCCPSLGC